MNAIHVFIGIGFRIDFHFRIQFLVAAVVVKVRFLRLVTANDGDVRMIVTFQDGAEADNDDVHLKTTALRMNILGGRSQG